MDGKFSHDVQAHDGHLSLTQYRYVRM